METLRHQEAKIHPEEVHPVLQAQIQILLPGVLLIPQAVIQVHQAVILNQVMMKINRSN